MIDFRVGDEVEVIGKHCYDRQIYRNECHPGDILIVTHVYQFALSCNREGQGDGAKRLRIDKDCVRLVVEPTPEEIASLFGAAPKPNHCPTCTCNAEEAP